MLRRQGLRPSFTMRGRGTARAKDPKAESMDMMSRMVPTTGRCMAPHGLT